MKLVVSPGDFKGGRYGIANFLLRSAFQSIFANHLCCFTSYAPPFSIPSRFATSTTSRYFTKDFTYLCIEKFTCRSLWEEWAYFSECFGMLSSDLNLRMDRNLHAFRILVRPKSTNLLLFHGPGLAKFKAQYILGYRKAYRFEFIQLLRS